METLFDLLNIDNDKNLNIDKIYQNIKNQNEKNYLAWKILRDKYYSLVYKKYLNIDLIYKAGFIDDKLLPDKIDYYNLNILTTPYNKILDNLNENVSNPIVLLSTGGFYPIHNGHLDMMELAKNELTNAGYDVVGGYFSLSHDNYIKTKPYYNTTPEQRLEFAQRTVNDHSWLMIDPFESIWCPTYVNFTEIINRLELYLKKYVDKRIKVVYVCGDDNVEFMYCFEEIGMGVCIKRNNKEKFDKFKKIFKGNKNIFFVDNQKDSIKLSSRNFREKISIESSKNCTGSYLIRDEDILPLETLLRYKNNNELNTIQQEALTKFKYILNEVFNNKINIDSIKVVKQLEDANQELKNKNTISLDSYYKGTFNLETSRMFEICDAQFNYTKLVERSNNYNLIYQISKIKSGNYILIDDDSVSGNTLKSIYNILPNNVNIDGIYLLMKKENIFDVIDFRDFIVGAKNSGLMVRLSNNLIIRVPYLFPFINLTSRASIPSKSQIDFTIKVLDLNIEFYKKINPYIKINELDDNLIKLLIFLNYPTEEYIITFLEHYKKILEVIKGT